MTIADNEIVVNNVRWTTFGNDTLWTAKRYPGGTDPTEYFNGIGILPKNHPQIPAIEKLMLKAAIEKFGPQKGPSVLKAAKLIGKVPLRDGDTKAEYDGFEGNMFISARSKDRPTVFNGMRQTVVRGDPGAPYDGCYVNMKISVYAYEKGNNGIGAGLKGVQYAGKGDAFSGGSPADPEDFDDIGVPEEGEADLTA